MATLKQIEANRRNAARSTGPRSSQGKARSRMNAFRHGLSSLDVAAVNEEEANMAGDEEMIDVIEGLHQVRTARSAMVAELQALLNSWQSDGVDRIMKRIAATTRYENRLYAARKRRHRKLAIKT